MSTVWIKSSSTIIAEALAGLVRSLGYEVQFEPKPPADLALWDYSDTPAHYSNAPLIPTLALVTTGTDEALARLLRLGYCGYLRNFDGIDSLKLALEALAQGEVWASPQVLTLARSGTSASDEG